MRGASPTTAQGTSWTPPPAEVCFQSSQLGVSEPETGVQWTVRLCTCGLQTWNHSLSPIPVWHLLPAVDVSLWCPESILLNSRLCRTLLSRVRLAFRASRHSSSNQGFDFLVLFVALGMQSFAALVMCWTKECKGSASSSISSEMLSKHTSWNCSQLALAKTQWEGSQLGCRLSLPLMVGSKSVWNNGHYHGYPAAPPTHFSEQVPVWKLWRLLLMLVCSYAGLGVSGRCGFRHWEYTDWVY